MSFADASRFARARPGEHLGAIDAEWAQGRGAYGGLVAAILARALSEELAGGQSLVTLTAALAAPASAGPARVTTEIVRAGRNVSTLRASLERDGSVIATALATAARGRDEAWRHDALAMPEVAPPEEVADGPREHYIPAFARFFEFRQCLGPVPFSGAREARVGGWCRLREDPAGEGPIDSALACALLDAWPPAAVALSPAWCPVASIEIRYDFFATGPPGWALFDAQAHHVGGGLADESATLWSRDGRVVATACQRIAIFPPSAMPGV